MNELYSSLSLSSFNPLFCAAFLKDTAHTSLFWNFSGSSKAKSVKIALWAVNRLQNICLKRWAVKTASKEQILCNSASASVIVSVLCSTYIQFCNASTKQSYSNSAFPKETLLRAFWCDHHLVVDTLCGRCSFAILYFFKLPWVHRFFSEKQRKGHKLFPNKLFAASDEPHAFIITRFETWSSLSLLCQKNCDVNEDSHDFPILLNFALSLRI